MRQNVQSDEVFEYSEGGKDNNTATAFWCVYIDKQLHQQLKADATCLYGKINSYEDKLN